MWRLNMCNGKRCLNLRLPFSLLLTNHALDDDGGVLPGLVLWLAEDDATHQRVSEHHLCRRHGRLVLRVGLVLQDRAADVALRVPSGEEDMEGLNIIK